MIVYSSFRDPSGFVFCRDDSFYRQINLIYRSQFEHLIESGLYKSLAAAGLLIEHNVSEIESGYANSFCVIKPDRVPFISYPYEWCFEQFKDAALTTLHIHKLAMEHDMILKDASAYNIQFINGVPKLIDTLSFDFYTEGSPWIAYGQFCRHFLAPLLLMSEIDIRLSQLMRVYMDGVPIDLAAKLLGKKGGFGARQHIIWHAKATEKHSQDGKVPIIKQIKISKFNHLALVDSLIRTIENIHLKNTVTEWAGYYKNTNYTDHAMKHKENILSKMIDSEKFSHIWDFGANDGRFSRIALNHGAKSVIAFDFDPIAVNHNYQTVRNNSENILPLILDLTNPSPGIGFANKERLPIQMRQRPDCILALALIHHLAISNNLPFEKIAKWFSELSDNLIIEFVPKEDSQVQILLATREDIFLNYNQKCFENAFAEYFDRIEIFPIIESERNIYLYKKRKEHS